MLLPSLFAHGLCITLICANSLLGRVDQSTAPPLLANLIRGGEFSFGSQLGDCNLSTFSSLQQKRQRSLSFFWNFPSLYLRRSEQAASLHDTRVLSGGGDWESETLYAIRGMGFDFEALADATAGAVGGLLSTTILYPLDTCKTKYQAEVRAGGSRKYRSLFDVLQEAISSHQFFSLYQGLGTKSLQSVISQFIYFYSYGYFKNLYLGKSKNKKMGTGANLLVAASAGACTAVLTQPLDTASTRMQTSTFGKSKGLWETLAEGTWKQAFDGIGTSLLLTTNPAIQYTVFEQLKVRLIGRQERLQRQGVNKSIQKQNFTVDSFPVVLSAFSAFMLGALSKTLATITTYPAIRCKVMIQASEPEEDKEQKTNSRCQEKSPKTILDAIRIIWQWEGASGFYKGLNAQILKTVLAAAVMLMIKEKISRGTWVVMMALRRWSASSTRRLKHT